MQSWAPQRPRPVLGPTGRLAQSLSAGPPACACTPFRRGGPPGNGHAFGAHRYIMLGEYPPPGLVTRNSPPRWKQGMALGGGQRWLRRVCGPPLHPPRRHPNQRTANPILPPPSEQASEAQPRQVGFHSGLQPASEDSDSRPTRPSPRKWASAPNRPGGRPTSGIQRTTAKIQASHPSKHREAAPQSVSLGRKHPKPNEPPAHFEAPHLPRRSRQRPSLWGLPRPFPRPGPPIRSAP
jgi:hypothetical protein